MTAVRIMIAEDERITAEDLHDILTDLGYFVTAVVATGADAVRQAEETAPDLVIMDIRLEGDMNGIEAARLIRTRAKIPIVYLTAHADQRMVERAKQAAPLGYIVKPFQEDELRASIEIALHKSAIDEYTHDTQSFLSARLSAIGTGVICTDQNGVVTSMNAIAEAWTGWKQRDAQNRRGEEVWGREELRIEYIADPLDEVRSSSDREMAIQRIDRQTLLGREIQLALAKIEQDAYGLCEQCEEPIPLRRLEAVPWARLCVPCQAEAEANGYDGKPTFEDAA